MHEPVTGQEKGVCKVAPRVCAYVSVCRQGSAWVEVAATMEELVLDQVNPLGKLETM